MVNIPRALFSGRTGRQPLYHIAIEELQEWAYTGEPLVPLKGYPGVVWQRSKKKKRIDREGMSRAAASSASGTRERTQSSHDLPPLRAPFKFDHVPPSRGLTGRRAGGDMKNKITGRSAFLALLKDEGVTHLFGNPGTTELPIMHALKDHPDLTYVMAMQESLVVAMADGFSRASGKLVACNVHVAPGLGNAMGSLYNASFTGTPLILTAGQQEQGHGLTEPVLYGPLVQMAEPLVKWAVEVTRLEDLPRIVRRAAKIATTPPTGPVFISLPGDILNAEAGIELGRSTRVDTRVKPSDESLQALTARILKAERPVIIVGDEIVKSDALQEAAQLAETLGCPAYQSSTPYGAHFLSESPCFMGALARIQKIARDTLAPYDLIIALGGDPLRMSVYSEIDPLPDGLVDRSGRPGRLGSCQELQRRDRAQGRRQGNLAVAGSGVEGFGRRCAGGAGEAGIGCAGVEELDGPAQAAGRADFESRQHLADRSGLAGLAGGRGNAR